MRVLQERYSGVPNFISSMMLFLVAKRRTSWHSSIQLLDETAGPGAINPPYCPRGISPKTRMHNLLYNLDTFGQKSQSWWVFISPRRGVHLSTAPVFVKTTAKSVKPDPIHEEEEAPKLQEVHPFGTFSGPKQNTCISKRNTQSLDHTPWSNRTRSTRGTKLRAAPPRWFSTGRFPGA